MAGRIAYTGGIVRDSLVFYLDAAKRDSYSGSGTLWRNLTGNFYNATLYNGPVYVNDGSVKLDGSDDYIAVPSFTYNRNSFSAEAYFKFTGTSGGYRTGIFAKWTTGAGQSNEFLIGSGVSPGGFDSPIIIMQQKLGLNEKLGTYDLIKINHKNGKKIHHF